jgi:hypothetical protein
VENVGGRPSSEDFSKSHCGALAKRDQPLYHHPSPTPRSSPFAVFGTTASFSSACGIEYDACAAQILNISSVDPYATYVSVIGFVWISVSFAGDSTFWSPVIPSCAGSEDVIGVGGEVPRALAAWFEVLRREFEVTNARLEAGCRAGGERSLRSD